MLEQVLSTIQQSNTQDQEDFLTTLFNQCTQGFVEIRQISNQSVVTQEWISLDDPTLSVFPNNQNIYFGVATRQNKKGGKADIVEITAVWVDIDFKDTDSKDTDRDEVNRRIKEFSLPPSIIVNSGNGYHLYWILKIPAKINDIPQIEDINKRLVNHFGGDKGCTDAAHILRLPGTYNIKYNPPILVTIEQIDQNLVYDLSDFSFLPLPPSSPQPAVAGNLPSPLTKLLDGVDEGERHTKLVSLAGHYRGKNLPEEETQVILDLWNRGNNPPLEEKELTDTIKYNYEHYGKNKVTTGLYGDDSYSLDDCHRIIEASIMLVPAFMRKQLPIKPYIITPLLKQGEIIMISAARGVGKTWFALTLAFMATRHLSISNWETYTPTPTLYIDGEMSEDELQDRIFKLKIGRQMEQAPLYLLSSDQMRSNNKKPPNLNNPVWRSGISEYLKSHSDIGLVILDNLASLTPGRDENKKRDWDDINQWFLELRSKGVAVIFLHHEGKGGDQRGTSAIEDNINFSIRLKRPEGYRKEDGANFIVEFTKTRRLYGNDAKPFTLQLQEDGVVLGWKVIADEEPKKAELIKVLLKEGKLKQNEIAKIVDVKPSYVSEVKKQMKLEEERSKRMKAVCGDNEEQAEDSPHTEEFEEVEH